MSRKDELLKLAELFHLQASRTGTPAVKQTLHRMGQYYRNEAAHAPDRDSGDPGSSIATLSRLRKPVEFKAPKKLLGYLVPSMARVAASAAAGPEPIPSNPVDRASDWDLVSSVGGHHGHCAFYRPRHSGVRHNR